MKRDFEKKQTSYNLDCDIGLYILCFKVYYARSNYEKR